MMGNDIPAIIRTQPDGRTARIAHDSDEETVRAAMFFTPEELLNIGVDPKTAEAVELRIVDSEVKLIPIVQEDQ